MINWHGRRCVASEGSGAPTPKLFAARLDYWRNPFLERSFAGNSERPRCECDPRPSGRCKSSIRWSVRASKIPDRFPRRGELWSADLNPRRGSEPGKVRPVVVVQSDLLNETDHPSTWVLPCTTRLAGEHVLRVELPAKIAGNARVCEVMIDQSRAIDRRRLLRPLGRLPQIVMREVSETLRRVGDLSLAR